jgi:hypothetical protein
MDVMWHHAPVNDRNAREKAETILQGGREAKAARPDCRLASRRKISMPRLSGQDTSPVTTRICSTDTLAGRMQLPPEGVLASRIMRRRV